jgi:hypothetical protein
MNLRRFLSTKWRTKERLVLSHRLSSRRSSPTPSLRAQRTPVDQPPSQPPSHVLVSHAQRRVSDVSYLSERFSSNADPVCSSSDPPSPPPRPPPPPKRRRLRKKRKERKGSTREKVSSRLFLDSIVEKAHLDRWLGIAPCCRGRRRESLFERGEVPLQDRQRLLLQRWLSSADSFIGGVCGS